MSRPTSLRPARVRVPASTSNLGPGFDVLGLALDRAVHVTYEPGEGPLEVEREGFAARIADGEDRVLAAFLAATEGTGDPTGRLRIRADIPSGRGLGSSAAAWLAGHLTGRTALGYDPDRDDLLGRTAAAEGHPDNAAPAVFGGLVAVAHGPAGLRTARLPLSPAVGLAYAEPGVEAPTAVARKALPETVGHGMVAGTAGRLAVLLHALAVCDPEGIRAGILDESHVPFRLPAIPGGEGAMEAGLGAGAWGVTISGSGSGMIAFAPRDRCSGVAEAMAEAFRRAGAPGGEAWEIRPDYLGARTV